MSSDTRADFWSRRRAAVAAEAESDTRAAEALTQAEEEKRLEARPDEEILAELDLPAPEEMERPDQVQALLKAAVPQRLKTRALRRLWRLNPVLANVDGLVDYGEDFTDANLVVENLQTLYQVGKGMFDKAAEAARAEQAAAEDLCDDAVGPEAPDQVRGCDGSAEAAHTDPRDAAAPAPETGPLAVPETPPADAPQPTGPRRMRFRFETAT